MPVYARCHSLTCSSGRCKTYRSYSCLGNYNRPMNKPAKYILRYGSEYYTFHSSIECYNKQKSLGIKFPQV